MGTDRLAGRHGTALAWPARLLGALLILAGLLVIVPAFVRFVVDGAGTPAPVAQTDRLVVGGPYRFVRNPMYVAVLLSIVGQAVLLGRWVLVVYGADYEAYRRAVPGWWPRPRAWFRG